MKVFVAGANGAYRAVDNARSRLSGRKDLDRASAAALEDTR